MFLTRLGPSAQCIITGDLSQVDLPFHQKSGLRRAIDLLEHLEGIEAVYLDAEDVVRHRLVKEIIRAYEQSDEAMHNRRRGREKEKDEGQTTENGNSPEAPPLPFFPRVKDEEE